MILIKRNWLNLIAIANGDNTRTFRNLVNHLYKYILRETSLVFRRFLFIVSCLLEDIGCQAYIVFCTSCTYYYYGHHSVRSNEGLLKFLLSKFFVTVSFLLHFVENKFLKWFVYFTENLTSDFGLLNLERFLLLLRQLLFLSGIYPGISIFAALLALIVVYDTYFLEFILI